MGLQIRTRAYFSKVDITYHVEESLKENAPPLRFRDGILDDYKKNMPEDRRQFNKMARKIHNAGWLRSKS